MDDPRPAPVPAPTEPDSAAAAAAPSPAPIALFLPTRALHALDDPFKLRDPHGRSRRPNLAPGERGGERGIWARGRFNLQQRYQVSKPQGIRFCEITGDENPIHLEGNVVPGAFTAARLLLALEVLFPDLSLRRFTMKFTSIATYGRVQFLQVRCEPGPRGASFRADVTEEGTKVAEMNVATGLGEGPPPALVPRRRVDVAALQSMRAFVQTLGVRGRAYFRRPEEAQRRSGGYYYYPQAFLASLPSGAMVRQLRGEGGLLNKLTLDFDPTLRVAITRDSAPLVELRPPKPRRSAFHKILTAIGNGLGTVVRGTALVFMGDATRGGAAGDEESHQESGSPPGAEPKEASPSPPLGGGELAAAPEMQH